MLLILAIVAIFCVHHSPLRVAMLRVLFDLLWARDQTNLARRFGAVGDGTLRAMDQRWVGLPLILLGVASGILWMSGRWPHPFAPVIALFLLLTGTTLLISKVGKLAKRMRPLLGKKVRVQVWGLDLAGSPGSNFTVHAVQAVGAGLHVYLRPVPNGSPIHLKVAQPLGTEISNVGVDISKAKYVQWAGSKIKKVEGKMALKLIVNDELPRHEVS